MLGKGRRDEKYVSVACLLGLPFLQVAVNAAFAKVMEGQWIYYVGIVCIKRNYFEGTGKGLKDVEKGVLKELYFSGKEWAYG